MREIKSIDNFFPKEMFDSFVDQYSDMPMQYGWKGGKENDPHGHWNYSFFRAGSNNLADCSDKIEGLISEMMDYTKSHPYFNGEDLTLIRCYINGHTFGVDGYFHQDSGRNDEFTTVLYMNKEWFPNWAGETVFLNTEDKTHLQRSVLPYPNRMVIFPSIISHAARGVSRKCLILRQTFMFKFRKKRTANFEKLSKFLVKNGATNLKHKDGSLHDHLVRVYQLLETNDFNHDVCFGGGLHSVFGTNAFTRNIFTELDKQKVINEFGERPVYLAELFSKINRPKYLENPKAKDNEGVTVVLNDGTGLKIDIDTYYELCAIECANLVDQNSLIAAKHPKLKAFWSKNVEKDK